jgi:putative DNA primase/helicase
VAPQRSTAYGPAALRRDLDALSGAAEGSRNHTLNRSAFVLGQLVGAGTLDETETADALLQTGLGIGLGERECQATIASGMSAGMANPRSLGVSD